MILRRPPLGSDERSQRAQSALRRAIWYLILLTAVVILLSKPQLLLRIWRQPTNPAYELLNEK